MICDQYHGCDATRNRLGESSPSSSSVAVGQRTHLASVLICYSWVALAVIH